MAPKWGPPTCLRQVSPDAVPVPLRLLREFKCSAGKRWNEDEGPKSRSALGPRRSRFRRGPRLRRIPPAAQHSRIAKVDEHFCVFMCVQPIWGRCGDAHDCSCGLQLKVIESMKEMRRLLPA